MGFTTTLVVVAGIALMLNGLPIVIINNPFSSTVAIWMFTGISLVAEAIVDVVVLAATK